MPYLKRAVFYWPPGPVIKALCEEFCNVRATPGKAHRSKLSLFVDNSSLCGSPVFQSLRIGFVTLSRLIDLNDSVFHVYFCIFPGYRQHVCVPRTKGLRGCFTIPGRCCWSDAYVAKGCKFSNIGLETSMGLYRFTQGRVSFNMVFPTRIKSLYTVYNVHEWADYTTVAVAHSVRPLRGYILFLKPQKARLQLAVCVKPASRGAGVKLHRTTTPAV